MALVSANRLGLRFLEKEIFQDVSFLIEEKSKTGLVGRNGAGKTSLFKLLTGELAPTEGDLYVAKTCKIGIMEQYLHNTAKTLFEELLTVFAHLQQSEAELEQLNARIEGGEHGEALILKQNQLQEYILENGGLVYQSQVRGTLLGLGFREDEFNRPVAELSGGERSKLCLAKLLLAKADLLLLDEPTNHLDITAVEWLEDFLKNYNGTFIVISHDRYFLDKTTNQTFDLENRKLKCYKGSYSDFLVKKEQASQAALRHNENVQQEIKRIEGIIEQQKRWNREKNLVTARSKQKSIDRLQTTLTEVDNQPKNIRLNFHTQAISGNDVLLAKDISKAFGEKKLFQHVDVHIQKGEKVFLLGDNGTGKSTLFKIILQQETSDTGEVKLGANVKTGYYDQTQKLSETAATVLDEIWNSFPKLSETEVRKALAAFLFVDKDLEKSCAVLSGGERARLGLLKIMLSGANLLLLDEPTNHLDIPSREALEEALADYQGTIIGISHDRFFINKLADRILHLANHKVTNFVGGYDYFIEKRAQLTQTVTETATQQEKSKDSQNKLDYQARKELASKLRKLNTQRERTEDKIMELEEAANRLDQQLALPEVATDYEKTLALSAQLEETKSRLEETMENWTEISIALEELEAQQNE